MIHIDPNAMEIRRLGARFRGEIQIIAFRSLLQVALWGAISDHHRLQHPPHITTGFWNVWPRRRAVMAGLCVFALMTQSFLAKRQITGNHGCHSPRAGLAGSAKNLAGLSIWPRRRPLVLWFRGYMVSIYLAIRCSADNVTAFT